MATWNGWARQTTPLTCGVNSPVETCVMSQKRGFTLVELLVVISIIALLVAILLPALNKARYSAKNVVCISHIRAQINAQLVYMTANDGKFPIHANGNDPLYVSAGPPGNTETDMVRDSMDGYIPDGEIFQCPALGALGMFYTESDFVFPDVLYGGWDAKMTNGERVTHTMLGYNWYANYQPGLDFKMEFHWYNEPPWPTKMSECTSKAAMVSHTITWFDPLPAGTGEIGEGVAWGWSHGDRPNFNGSWDTDSDDSPFNSNPVGYADSHVITRQRSEVRIRARVPDDAPWGSFTFGYAY